jgi:hypothetical protein
MHLIPYPFARFLEINEFLKIKTAMSTSFIKDSFKCYFATNA